MTEDVELMFARRLGDVLGEMRAALDQKAIRRVLTFILSRHGIDVINNTFFVEERTDTVSRQAVSHPPAQSAPMNLATVPKPPSVRLPLTQDTCPICGYSGVRKGVQLHMIRKHGTTPKEYQRTKALDSTSDA